MFNKKIWFFIALVFLLTSFSSVQAATPTFNTGLKISSGQSLQFVGGGSLSAASYSGNASTTSALSANPTNCSAGQAAAGIAANGSAEGCVSIGVSSQWTTSGSNIYYNTGNVGIGTSSPGYKLDVAGDVRAQSSWFRTTGSTGWYNESYGGGWHMTDSTWIRSYNGKGVYIAAALRSDGGIVSGSTTSLGAGTIVATGDITTSGYINAVGFNYSSDRNLKKNIATIENPLDKILNLRGVTFNWKKDNKPGVGLIAQEVEQVFPELVSTNNGFKAVQYGNLIAPLIEAVKAQQKEINNLEARIKILEINK